MAGARSQRVLVRLDEFCCARDQGYPARLKRASILAISFTDWSSTP
jgi:hypothetical protein